MCEPTGVRSERDNKTHSSVEMFHLYSKYGFGGDLPESSCCSRLILLLLVVPTAAVCSCRVRWEYVGLVQRSKSRV